MMKFGMSWKPHQVCSTMTEREKHHETAFFGDEGTFVTESFFCFSDAPQEHHRTSRSTCPRQRHQRRHVWPTDGHEAGYQKGTYPRSGASWFGHGLAFLPRKTSKLLDSFCKLHIKSKSFTMETHFIFFLNWHCSSSQAKADARNVETNT